MIEGNPGAISFNTANNNTGGRGIGASGGVGHLVAGNVAMDNEGGFDYAVNCPSSVTNNDSTDWVAVRGEYDRYDGGRVFRGTDRLVTRG